MLGTGREVTFREVSREPGQEEEPFAEEERQLGGPWGCGVRKGTRCWGTTGRLQCQVGWTPTACTLRDGQKMGWDPEVWILVTSASPSSCVALGQLTPPPGPLTSYDPCSSAFLTPF